MFMWRAASEKNWLFDREDLHPLIETEPYVEALDLMVRTHAKYRDKQQAPGVIWSAVKSGELRGGIGFPRSAMESNAEFQIGDLPGVTDLSRLLLDPYSPVGSLSVNCRQTAVSKRFVGWISGGEGSETVRREVSGMTTTRGAQAGGAEVSPNSQANAYDEWLATRLDSPVTLPTLQILRAGDYYAALDAEVARALAGEATPAQALAEVAKQWRATTKEVGTEKQLRVWRRVQGMRS